MGSLAIFLNPRDKNDLAPTEAPATGLGDLGKLPRELRDIVYEAVLGGAVEKYVVMFVKVPGGNTDIKAYPLRPYYGAACISQVSSAIRKDITPVVLVKSHVQVRGYRNIHRLTTLLTTNNAFGSLRSLISGGMHNIRTLLSHIDKFPALQSLRIGMCTSVLARVEYRVNEPTADSVAKIVQKYRLEKLLVCTTLRYLTLNEFSSDVCICKDQSNERALRGLGLWLTKECEERKISVRVGLVQICEGERNGRSRGHATTSKRLY